MLELKLNHVSKKGPLMAGPIMAFQYTWYRIYQQILHKEWNDKRLTLEKYLKD